jgi:hypothetical protein
MRRTSRIGAALAVARLAGFAHAQGYFGGDEGVCGPENDFRELGCYEGDLTGPGTNYPFAPGAWDPVNGDPSLAFPGWDPGSKYDNTVAPYGCQKACRGHGFKYAAFTNSVCHCGMLPPPDGTNTGTLCNRYCPADDQQECGGADTMIYVDASFADPAAVTADIATTASYYKYIGCFVFGRFNTQNNDIASGTCTPTVEECHQYCATNGYPLAAAIYNDPDGVQSEWYVCLIW